MKESKRLNDKVVQIVEFSRSASDRIGYRFDRVNLTILVEPESGGLRLRDPDESRAFEAGGGKV
ncbi:hypothetical protein AB6A23_19380 [Paenibacillus tarimensis]